MSDLKIHQIMVDHIIVDIAWKDELMPVKKISFGRSGSSVNDAGIKPEILSFAGEIRDYLLGKKTTISTDLLDYSGLGIFTLRVLEELRKVPYGSTVSYMELAEVCGSRASRAVGTVMSKNRFLLVYPCHRVIKSGGQAGFYAGGSEMKNYLLEMERKNAGRMVAPAGWKS